MGVYTRLAVRKGDTGYSLSRTGAVVVDDDNSDGDDVGHVVDTSASVVTRPRGTNVTARALRP